MALQCASQSFYIKYSIIYIFVFYFLDQSLHCSNFRQFNSSEEMSFIGYFSLGFMIPNSCSARKLALALPPICSSAPLWSLGTQWAVFFKSGLQHCTGSISLRMYCRYSYWQYHFILRHALIILPEKYHAMYRLVPKGRFYVTPNKITCLMHHRPSTTRFFFRRFTRRKLREASIVYRLMLRRS